MDQEKPDLINVLTNFTQEFAWVSHGEALYAAKDDAKTLLAHPDPKEEIDRFARGWTGNPADITRIKTRLELAMNLV